MLAWMGHRSSRGSKQHLCQLPVMLSRSLLTQPGRSASLATSMLRDACFGPFRKAQSMGSHFERGGGGRPSRFRRSASAAASRWCFRFSRRMRRARARFLRHSSGYMRCTVRPPSLARIRRPQARRSSGVVRASRLACPNKIGRNHGGQCGCLLYNRLSHH